MKGKFSEYSPLPTPNLFFSPIFMKDLEAEWWQKKHFCVHRSD